MQRSASQAALLLRRRTWQAVRLAELASVTSAALVLCSAAQVRFAAAIADVGAAFCCLAPDLYSSHRRCIVLRKRSVLWHRRCVTGSASLRCFQDKLNHLGAYFDKLQN